MSEQLEDKILRVLILKDLGFADKGEVRLMSKTEYENYKIKYPDSLELLKNRVTIERNRMLTNCEEQ